MPLWAALAIGAGAAIVGLLPWLVTGMRLPLQNLWASSTMPDEMPLALLPFSQYAIILIVALLVTGGAVAGIAARALRGRLPRFGVTAILSGVVAVQLVAIAQSAVTVRAGLADRTESTLYLAALIGVAALSALFSVLVLLLIATSPRAGAVIGLSLAALAVGPWVSGLLSPIGSLPGDAALTLLGAVHWIPPVLVGAAIAWGGVNSVGRIAAAVVGLALVWLVPAFVTAVSSAAGSRVLARVPQEMLEYAVQVFGMATTIPSLALPPILVTVVVATIGLTAGAFVRRSRRLPAGA